ncbi:MAG: hypothetical protein AABX97_01365 [Candidatus Thermoplasmatota archaeon]
MVLVIRRLRRDERGVASTVGTIMALLVFLTFLSLIVNQYVPVWMKDSEAAHINGAIGQFGGIKGAIDLQVLGAQMAQNSGSVFIPTTSSTAVTLGVDGVPIFSAPTLGQLSSNPDQGAWNISFAYRVGPSPGVLTYVWQNASGQIDLYVGNRYYIPQHIVYENGAVIRSQTDGQVIRAEPTFQAAKSGTNMTLAFQLVNLYGQGGLVGTTTEVVNTKVFGVNLQTYTSFASGITVKHTSAYGLAWYNFLNATLASAYGVKQGQGSFLHNTFITHFTAPSNFYDIVANLDTSNRVYTLTLTINTVVPIGSFTLQTAYVQVGIGEQTNTNG